MKVSEILKSDMTDDNTIITITKPLAIGARVFRGNWYQDQIIEFADEEVAMLIYDKAGNKIGMEVQ